MPKPKVGLSLIMLLNPAVIFFFIAGYLRPGPLLFIFQCVKTFVYKVILRRMFLNNSFSILYTAEPSPSLSLESETPESTFQERTEDKAIDIIALINADLRNVHSDDEWRTLIEGGICGRSRIKSFNIVTIAYKEKATLNLDTKILNITNSTIPRVQALEIQSKNAVQKFLELW